MTDKMTALPARIASKIAIDPMAGCWAWTGSLGQYGYGQVRWKGKRALAHRVVYTLCEADPGPLSLDHLCRNRACVNPDHLEPVPHELNVRRGDAGIENSIRLSSRTHCANGHEYTPENTYVPPSTSPKQRQCRVCRRAAKRRYNASKEGSHA